MAIKTHMKPTLFILLAGLASFTERLSVAASFTPLVPVHPKKVFSIGDTLSNGFPLTNFFDGNLKTEYASHDLGTNTVIQFEFDAATRVTAIRHVDRNDGATVAESQLEFMDENGKWSVAATITHTNQRLGQTFLMLPGPISAKAIKWHVTKIGDPGLFSVGGAELTLLNSEPSEH